MGIPINHKLTIAIPFAVVAAFVVGQPFGAEGAGVGLKPVAEVAVIVAGDNSLAGRGVIGQLGGGVQELESAGRELVEEGLTRERGEVGERALVLMDGGWIGSSGGRGLRAEVAQTALE